MQHFFETLKADICRLKKAKLGVMLGVYLPTIQHILGLLMFIRHAWIVGCSGVVESFFMVLMCCITVRGSLFLSYEAHLRRRYGKIILSPRESL